MRSPRKLLLGVTLVELMVSLAVLAILATVAVPSFVDFLDKNRVRGAADAVVSLVSSARAEAVKNDLDVSIAMVGSGAAWCMGGNAATPPSGGLPAGAADPCDCIDPADATECLIAGQRFVIEVGAYPDVRVGTLPAPLTFDSTLGAISPLGSRSVVLTSPRGKYDLSIQINSLGQARLCIPAGKPLISGIAPC
ncbi:GspH/FimT family pseudopilin [Lysobacter sp. CFH 32150]|uniref:GspH/FimT family pseudopilin n=1 Tax=Lysobacter sp. CFH 32150 TaxID=2927128 RepID=UPI001FA6EBC6|nr:GspH/FimT family pseudopilin [Lysobacter sp. CFH 32150]MCI4567396.1 GspH/FimT family pseudopilin [Lysobacter sp. CFH 32150]